MCAQCLHVWIRVGIREEDQSLPAVRRDLWRFAPARGDRGDSRSPPRASRRPPPRHAERPEASALAVLGMAWLDSVDGAPRDVFGVPPEDTVHPPPGSSPPPDAPRASADPGRDAGARVDQEESEGNRTCPTEAALPGFSPQKGSSTRSVCTRNRSARRTPPTDRVPAGQEKDKRENPAPRAPTAAGAVANAAGRRKRKKEASRRRWGEEEEPDRTASSAPRSHNGEAATGGKRERQEGRDGEPRGEDRRREGRRDRRRRERRRRGDRPRREEPSRGAGRDGQSHHRDAGRQARPQDAERDEGRRRETEAAAQAGTAEARRDEDGGGKRAATDEKVPEGAGNGDGEETTASRSQKPPPHGDGKDARLVAPPPHAPRTQDSCAEKFPGQVRPEHPRSENPALQLHARDSYSEKLPERMLGRDSFSEKPARPLRTEGSPFEKLPEQTDGENSYSEKATEPLPTDDSYSERHPEQIHDVDFYSEKPTEPFHTEDSYSERHPEQKRNCNFDSDKSMEPLHTKDAPFEKLPEQIHNQESCFETLPEQIDGENSYSEKPTEPFHTEDSPFEKLPEQMDSENSDSEKLTEPLHTEDSYSERHPQQIHNRESYFEKLPEQIDGENSYSEKPTEHFHTEDSYSERHPEQINNRDFYSEKLPEQIDGEKSFSEKPTEPFHAEDSYSERHPEQINNRDFYLEKLPEQIDDENSYSEKPTEHFHTDDSYSERDPEQIHNRNFYSEKPTEPSHTEDSYSEELPEKTHDEESPFEKRPEQTDSENSDSEKLTEPLRTEDSYSERRPQQIHNRESYFEKLPEQIDGANSYSEKPTAPLHTEDSYSERHPEEIRNREPHFKKLPERVDVENSYSEKPTKQLDTDGCHAEKVPEQIHNRDSYFETLPEQMDGENSSSEKPTEPFHGEDPSSERRPEHIDSVGSSRPNWTPAHLRTEDSSSEKVPAQIRNEDSHCENVGEQICAENAPFARLPERGRNGDFDWPERTTPPRADTRAAHPSSEKPPEDGHRPDSCSATPTEQRHAEDSSAQSGVERGPGADSCWEKSRRQKPNERRRAAFSVWERLPKQTDAGVERPRAGDSLPRRGRGDEASRQTCSEAFGADDERKCPQGLASFSSGFGGMLLRSGVVSLPGSRDRNGRALLTVDAGAGAVWSHPECRGGELLRLMRYYVSTLSVGAPAATVLVDARRAAPAPALLSALEAAREEVLGRALVLMDEDSDSALRVDPPAQVEVVTSLECLARHVDAHQLPRELGGSFRFSHSDWLAFRWRVERLGGQCEDVIELLRKNIAIMEDTPLPDTQQEAERQLSVYRQLMGEVLGDGRLARLQREGAASLSLLLRERGGPSEERRAAAAAVSRLYRRVDELLHRLVTRNNGRTRQLREFGRPSAAFAQAYGWALESRHRPAAVAAEGDAPAEERRRRHPPIAEAAFRETTSLADDKLADARPAGDPSGWRPRSGSAETLPDGGPRRAPLLRRLFGGPRLGSSAGSAPSPHPLRKSQSFDGAAAPRARRSGPSAVRGPGEPARRGNTGVFIRGLEVSGAEAGTESSPAEGDGRKLRHIVEEMVTTEREYVRSLHYVIAHYFPEMERADLPQDLRGKRSVVFGNLEKLLDFHAHFFLKELEACWKDPLRVAHCFLRHQEQLGLYALYSKNKPKSDALLASRGLAFFKRKQRELGDRMDLCSYLLKPVQRMSKYALLLDDLIKEAGAAPEAERAALRTALAAVRFQLRRGNDLLAMDAIRRCDVDLKEQGRLLRQDRFTVWSGRRKCRRRVFLFDELLLLSKAKKTDGGLEVFEYKRSFKTSDLGLTESRGDDGLRFEIWFRKRTAKNQTLTLQAASADVKCAWTRELAAILWTQATRNKEARLKEMLSMGVGDRPYLDIRPSAAAISDRAVHDVARIRGARRRASVAVSASDCAAPFSSDPSSAGPRGSLDLRVLRYRTSGGDVEEDELERDTASQRSVTTGSSGSSSRCRSGSTGSDSGCVSSPPRDPSSASSGSSHKAGAGPVVGPTTSV